MVCSNLLYTNQAAPLVARRLRRRHRRCGGAPSSRWLPSTDIGTVDVDEDPHFTEVLTELCDQERPGGSPVVNEGGAGAASLVRSGDRVGDDSLYSCNPLGHMVRQMPASARWSCAMSPPAPSGRVQKSMTW